ncbi:altered inheritance of mitochondria protein 11 [Metschnikowia bicuspidata var. bicuspidata NRRL YB-4993]|uniref:Altered inheritance of mitochondria protein 11 n=1 Tax=Metschnikowia bicuspidata var. bicuspidata NRRL YB-4993 TaxID=869754 RepID=A0A1A0HFC5_9ASCO|nr:altered inheritance of mitochondria protein 11 [Metschnikowia bicuspidata var. bicuspidata NRRL YB-4993]OBA22701.1 altered inheritance of mitochondria protein 11 [Metschnikowia bicuspidata var. bicuspidata NRRL YB-4993]
MSGTVEKSKLRDTLHKLNFKIADASPEYIARRKKQATFFLAAAAMTIFTSRFAHRTAISRQYIPSLFQGNHQPPLSYNFAMDAAVAVGTGTMLCGSVLSMIAFGACWVMDVSTLPEFGWRMKSLLGGYKSQQELEQVAIDEESKTIEDGINDLLEGNLDLGFDIVDESA